MNQHGITVKIPPCVSLVYIGEFKKKKKEKKNITGLLYWERKNKSTNLFQIAEQEDHRIAHGRPRKPTVRQ